MIASALQLRTDALASRQRRWLLLRGDACDTARAVEALIEALRVAPTRSVWLSDQPRPDAVALARATTLLGGECDLLVIDGSGGFDLDALGAAVGTLGAGGLLVLLTGTATAPIGRCDRRLARLLAAAPPPPGAAATDPGAAPPMADANRAATPDQARALAVLLALAQGRARRPLVLIADRGRGKSAALGLAAAQLLSDGWPRVLVSAPRRAAVAGLFAHAGAPARLGFVPPDALAAAIDPGDLVLVDEAAGIPAPLLEAILTRTLAVGARLAFATTVHGYEGTGHGFELRFADVLTRLAPGWRALRLTQPIRWAVGDPLEALVNRLLLLDAEPAADDQVRSSDPAAARLTVLDRDRLADDEPLLRQVFGLLVLAHYQTRPADLRHLLDAPNLSVAVLQVDALVLATALVAAEGGLAPDLLGPIFNGQRRPHGHLLALTLSTHAGLFDAPARRFARIVRIAVHPAMPRRGLGRRLVAGLAERARGDGVDLLGASFGATPDLIAFWRATGLAPVHLGTHRNAASGAHAAVVLRGLTPSGAGLVKRARTRLLPRLVAQLSGPLRGLAPTTVAALVSGAPPVPAALNADDWRELASFAHGHRGLDAVLALLEQLLKAQLPGLINTLAADETAALIACVLQRQDPVAAAAHLGLSGQAALIARLRAAVAAVLAGRDDGP